MTTSSPPPLALRPRSARSSCRAWPKRPVQERFAVIDTTTERLTVESGTSPRGLVVVRGERDGWFAGHAKDTGKTGGTDVPNWLSVYEAGRVRCTRRTGGSRKTIRLGETDRKCTEAICRHVEALLDAKIGR